MTISFEDLDARRGEYRTREARVVVDVAVSVSDAPRVVTHELAHHAFVACGGYVDEGLRTAFYEAQGLPYEREWFDYSAGWEANPAELFAEAMTALIDGATAHGVAVTSSAKSVVLAWMEGRPLDSMAVPDTTTTSTTTSTTSTTTTSTTTTTIAPPTPTVPVAPPTDETPQRDGGPRDSSQDGGVTTPAPNGQAKPDVEVETASCRWAAFLDPKRAVGWYVLLIE